MKKSELELTIKKISAMIKELEEINEGFKDQLKFGIYEVD
jgi:hypothetical protein